MTRLLFAGDLLVAQDHTHLADAPLTDFIRGHDIACVNLEGPLPTDARPIAKIGCPLTQASHTPELLRATGFNLVTLANNHIADYGLTGIATTTAKLSDLTTLGAGNTLDETYRHHTITHSGTRFSFINLAEWGFGAAEGEDGGFAWLFHPRVPELLRTARADGDVLIVIVHAGAELATIPLPQWRTHYRTLIDAGVDIVVGHHPHVLQGYETYKTGHIFYSLGNFLFPISQQADGELGVGGVLSLSFTDRTLSDWSLRPLTLKNGYPTLDDRPAATSHAKDLNDQLSSPRYETLVRELTHKLWHTQYHHLYESAVGGFHTLRGLLRALRDQVTGRLPKHDLLTHNLRIETHRFVVETFTTNRSKDQ
jgi:hypothetical protein